MIARKLFPYIADKLKPGFAVGLFGARRTGKTVLMHQLAEITSGKSLIISGEDFDVQESFWRTYTQKEIDYLEEREGILHAYEMKYSGRSTKVPAVFMQNYPDSQFNEINKDNFFDFLKLNQGPS